MFFDLAKAFIRSIGAPFVQLDAALPGPVETDPPISVPGTTGTAAPFLRILLPILAAAVIIVLLCLLYRRHGKKKAEACAEPAAAEAEKEEE